MAAVQEAGTDDGGADEELYAVLLGKCVGIGAVLGVVGVAVFLGLMIGAGITWSGVGLIPALLAGLGVRWVADERGGYVTGLVALLTGQGPVLLMYLVLAGVLGLGPGRGDVVIILFGIYISFKLGMGTDGSEETLADRADAEDVEDVDLPEGVTEAEAREVLTSEDPDPEEVARVLGADEEAVAGASDAERAVGAASDGAPEEPAEGGPSAAESSAGGADEDGTASDFVEPLGDEE